MGQFRLALGSCWDSVFSLGAVKAPDAFRSGGDKGGVLFFFCFFERSLWLFVEIEAEEAESGG